MQNNLKSLLDSWQPQAPEASDFRRNVWQRIERQRKAPTWFDRAIELIGRPRIAVGMFAAAVLLGAVVGKEVSASTQSNEYLRSVNPYAQVR